MTDQPDTPKILEEIAKSNAAQPAARSNRRKIKARRRILIIVVLATPIFAGMLMLGYRQTLLQAELAAMTAENQGFSASLNGQGGQLQNIQEQLARPPQPVPVDDSAVRALAVSVNDEFAVLRRELVELQAEQEALAQAPNFEWKLMEAEYLLRIANHKLILEADIESAIVLAKDADAALVDSGNNNVFGVREAIAVSLGQLAGVQPLDRDGIYLRIANLDRQVDGINLLQSMRQGFERRRSTSSEPVAIGGEETGFADPVVNFLSSVFVWREWDQTPEAMLAPGQESSIKQTLRLFLQQAQLALLQRDQELFGRSLGNAREWLQRYSVTESALGQSMAAELDELIAIDVDPQLPTLEQPLALIGQLTRVD